MAEPRNERQLVDRIIRAVSAEYPDAWILKTHSNGYQRDGVPDLLICKDGRLFGFEVKHRKPGETLDGTFSRVSQPQRKELRDLSRASASAAVVWTVEQVMAELSAPGTLTQEW